MYRAIGSCEAAALETGQRLLAALSLLGSTALFSAVPATAAGERAWNVTRNCIEKYDPAIDYFPEKVTIEDAVNFSVSYHRSSTTSPRR